MEDGLCLRHQRREKEGKGEGYPKAAHSEGSPVEAVT